MPRRNHSAILIKRNAFMLIYGGRNDHAKQYSVSADFDLGDLMLLNLSTFDWTAVS